MYRDSLEYAQDRFSNVLESCTVLTPAEVMEVNTPLPDGQLNRPSQTP